MEWDTGEKTWEPLVIMAKDDPISCANYAEDNDMLNVPGWKMLRRIIRLRRKVKMLLNKVKSNKRPIYKYGIKLPRNYKHALEIDKEAGNDNWKNAYAKEIELLFEYGTFKDLGIDGIPPEDYKKIVCSWVVDVKHDLRHRARCVAGGHLTPPEQEDAYSGVCSLRNFRLALLIGVINNLKYMVGDVGSAYLEAFTREKVYFIAGPEFGELEGHVLLIVKALYGLRTSGARFHERFHDSMLKLGFKPSRADPDLWMRDGGDTW